MTAARGPRQPEPVLIVMAGVDGPAPPMPALLVCHAQLAAAYPDIRLARAAGARHLHRCQDLPVKTVTWRQVDALTWTAHARRRDLDHQVVVALSAPTHGAQLPKLMPGPLLAKMPINRRGLGRLQHTYPWHYTHEFTRVAEGLAAFVACTSLDDTPAEARARHAPSGTSGGWRRRDQTAEPCPDRPDTHRHLLFAAAITG